MTMATDGASPWLLIANPRAGKGAAMRQHERLAELFKARGLAFDLVVSETAGDPVRLAQRGLRDGYRKLAAVGGDGTLHQIVNGIFATPEVDTLSVTLGLIPVGTGNDWARDVGIPGPWDRAVELLAREHTVLQDVGQIEGPGVAGEALPPGKAWFINVAGVGFDAFVVQSLHQKRSSRLIYLWGAISNLARFAPVPLALTIDEAAQGEAPSFAVFIALRRYCGQGMQVAPGAVADDGLFEVIRIPGFTRLEVLWNLRRLYDGSILEHPGVRHARAREVRITAPSGTPAEADGELVGAAAEAGLIFRVLPRALRVVVP